MRGLTTFIIGLVVGLTVPLFWWPRIPTGIAPPADPAVHIILSDRYLATLVQSHFNVTSTARITHLTVRSLPPSALIGRGTVSASGLSVPVTVEAAPTITHGALSVRIVNASVGPLPVPVAGFFSSAVTAAIRQAVGIHLRVTDVRVTRSGLALSGNDAP